MVGGVTHHFSSLQMVGLRFANPPYEANKKAAVDFTAALIGES
jgi:hypothetical protein